MLHPGEQIGVWTIDERLGHGPGPGVYGAHHPEDHSLEVAIQVLDPSRGDWRILRQRLLHDAESLLGLSHPNLAKVRNIWVTGHMPHIEFERVRGQTMSLPKQPLSPSRVVGWLLELADGLAAMHAKGIRHRDIKLSNIMLRRVDQRLVLVGLGTFDEPVLKPPPQLNTLPPEACAPGPADPVARDIYGVGIVAWELLTGLRAFRDASMQGMEELARLKHALGPLDPGEELPLDLRALVRDLTHPNTRKRLRTATQLVERLEALNMERTDPRFTFDKGVSTWDPDDPKSQRMSDAESNTWHPLDYDGELGEEDDPTELAAPTMPPPEPSDPPQEYEPDPPTEELDRIRPSQTPQGTQPGVIAVQDRTSQLLIALIVLLLIALGVSLGVLLTR